MFPQDPLSATPDNNSSQSANYGDQNPPATDPKHPVHNPLSVMAPGEQMICEIRRHPIGILGIYIMTGLLLIVLAILAFIVTPHVVTSSGHQATVVGALIFLVVGTLAVGFVLVAHIVYWGNSWVVTSDSVTQITQTSLLRKQSSQLSLGNLEDVSATQDGILPHMFNFGVLRVETAGERSKFLFPFCPNPSYYAKQILAARENFEQGRQDNNPQRLYRQENTYQPPPANQPPNYHPAEPSPNPAPLVFQTPSSNPNPSPTPPPATPLPAPGQTPAMNDYSPPAAPPPPEPPTFPSLPSESPAPTYQPPAYLPTAPAPATTEPQNPSYNSYTPPPPVYGPPPDHDLNVS